jgi:hypothetical protein
MRRPFVHVFVTASVLGALASCATVSGLADKETVDCPGGCIDGAPPPRPTSSSSGTTDSAPPDANADDAVQPDAETGFVKPDGWELVAVAATTNNAPAPGCPAGFDDASDVGTQPTASNDTCDCGSCAVTQQAACTGQPTFARGDATASTCPTVLSTFFFRNDNPGGCNTDVSGIDRTGDYYKVKLATPSGGTCNAGAATPHPDRVNFVQRRRVCDETARCMGSICDATVPAPFSACVASPKGAGDKGCPTGFPQKLVAGAANVTCGGGCACSVVKSCTGTFTFYKDNNCTTGAAAIAADDTCRNANTSGSYDSYKIVAIPTTTCTPAGNPNATVTPKDVRTICCR